MPSLFSDSLPLISWSSQSQTPTRGPIHPDSDINLLTFNTLRTLWGVRLWAGHTPGQRVTRWEHVWVCVGLRKYNTDSFLRQLGHIVFSVVQWQTHDVHIMNPGFLRPVHIWSQTDRWFSPARLWLSSVIHSYVVLCRHASYSPWSPSFPSSVCRLRACPDVSVVLHHNGTSVMAPVTHTKVLRPKAAFSPTPLAAGPGE